MPATLMTRDRGLGVGHGSDAPLLVADRSRACRWGLVPAQLAAQSVSPKKVAAALERVFGRGLQVDTIATGSASVFRVARADTLLGFARVLDVRGKDQPISVLVATDTALLLRDIDILVYREPYGGEVAYDSWRRQFRGPIRPHGGREIRSISATTSVNAVTSCGPAEFRRWRRRAACDRPPRSPGDHCWRSVARLVVTARACRATTSLVCLRTTPLSSGRGARYRATRGRDRGDANQSFAEMLTITHHLLAMAAVFAPPGRLAPESG
jgi:hypothetical protein